MTSSKRKRFPHVVCKPCWELQYCPYGPLVEQFPLEPQEYPVPDVQQRYSEILSGLAHGQFKAEEEILSAIEVLLFHDPHRWKRLDGYRTEELRCLFFGHVCPVFFVAEPFTETKAVRRPCARHIPREVMLKVVRRDGQMCQICGRNVPDTELAFDHIIPVSRGGPSTVANLRVLCNECNARKSDSLTEILLEPRAEIE